MNKFLWKIGGEAGFGIMTTGLFFSKIACRLGYHVFDYVQYPSLIRGGHNSYDVAVSDKEVYSLKKEIDFLVCLNQDTYNLHKNRLTSASCVVYDEEEFRIEEDFIKINVPFKKIISDLKGNQVMKNTIALGASLSLLGADIQVLYDLIEKQFGRKGEKIVTFNKQFAENGYQYIKENYRKLIKNLLTNRNSEEKIVLSGNESFSLGSVIADCRFYAAYPMTPSSSVLTTLADWQEKSGMVVRHAEDEISVINTALGASYAGVRSAVGTSGGGFALMVESISFAGIAEIPIVVFVASRPGPATGMPTWTEQGDLLFAVHSGHGEFPKIVLAPGDVAEMVTLVPKAFDLADIYQTPVIILSDMLLSESHQTLARSTLNNFLKGYRPERGKTIQEYNGKKYLRYRDVEDGISERLIPGVKDYFYQANSYEHYEDGHTTEEATERIKQVNKRNKKSLTYLKHHFQGPTVYGDFKKAKAVVVSFGSMKGTILEAQKLLKEQGSEIAYLHFTHIYPLDEEKIKPFFSEDKRYILIENNSLGQFGKLLRQETGINIQEKLLKYDGRPFWPEEIVSNIKNKI